MMHNTPAPAGDGGLPEPTGFSAGSLFSTSRSVGTNYAIGAGVPLLVWYSPDQMRAAIAAKGAELSAMRERLAEAVRDAERYRWLRRQHWDAAPLAVVASPRQAIKLGHDSPSLERLDAAIDAAMTHPEDSAKR